MGVQYGDPLQLFQQVHRGFSWHTWLSVRCLVLDSFYRVFKYAIYCEFQHITRNKFLNTSTMKDFYHYAIIIRSLTIFIEKTQTFFFFCWTMSQTTSGSSCKNHWVADAPYGEECIHYLHSLCTTDKNLFWNKNKWRSEQFRRGPTIQ